MRVSLVTAILLLLAASAQADEVLLRDGTRVSGKIMVRSSDRPLVFQLPTSGVRVIPLEEIEEVQADDPPESYLRFHRYREDWSRLEVLSRTLSKEGAPSVTLVGAVHVADPVYYRRLQHVLDRHDVVLFEGIGAAPVSGLESVPLPDAEQRKRELARPFTQGTLEESDLSASDPLTMLQTTMASTLELSFQKDGLDYSHSWWIPADATVDQLGALYQDSEGSVLSDFAGMSADPKLQESVNRIVAETTGEALKGLVGPKSMQLVLKEAFAGLLASQLQALDPGANEEGADLGLFQEVLIVGRNQVVMQRLNELLERSDVGTIAIFYGAGHNLDLEQRIQALGYRNTRDEWIAAWNMEPAE